MIATPCVNCYFISNININVNITINNCNNNNSNNNNNNNCCGSKLGRQQTPNSLTEREERSSWRMEEITIRDRQLNTLHVQEAQWNEYKNTKIKAAVELNCNADPTMVAVRSFEELAVQNGRHSSTKDAKKHAEKLDLQLWLNFPNPVAVADGKEVETKKVKQAIDKAHQQDIQSTVSEERWQGKLIKNRWDDEKVKLEECFVWLSS